MEPPVFQIFVYGSLRSGFHHPAYAYISRYFTLHASAKVKGRLYDMGEYPAAVPTNDDCYILGELYQINQPEEFSWAIAQLDDYEGINTEEGESPLYRREIASIQVNNQNIEAWMYWFNGDITGKPHIESGDVLEYMHQKNKL